MADSEAIRRPGDQLFSRTAGAPLVRGNAVRLLRDAAENYPAWLAEIGSARRSVHFENYILHDDEVGQRFADAFLDKARDGVAVRVVHDWPGWRDTGVEVAPPARPDVAPSSPEERPAGRSGA